MRVLIAEDDRDLNEIIVKRLKAEGYAADSCFDGAEALDYLDAVTYDIAILDIMMPKADGLTVVSTLRKKGSTMPVLFLTARDTVSDKVQGLDKGANDYMVKPFSFDELLARIRALTRTSAGSAANLYTAGDLTLDSTTHTVVRAGKEISLTSREFALLEYLMRNKGKVLSRQKIEDSVWDFDYGGGTNVVDVYITYLRKKINDEKGNRLIHTIRGVGYQLKEQSKEK